jgi:hypothetical protein
VFFLSGNVLQTNDTGTLTWKNTNKNGPKHVVGGARIDRAQADASPHRGARNRA